MITATFYAPGLTVSVLPTGSTGATGSTGVTGSTGTTGSTGSSGPLVLTKLSPPSAQTPYGGYSFQFCIGTVMPSGQVHQVWRGTNTFDCVTGAWATQEVKMSDGSAAPTIPENFGQCWVPTVGTGVVYQGTAAPGGLFCTFDPATGIYTNVPSSQGATQGDSCLLYDAPRNQLVTFGGYTNPPTYVRTMAVPGGNWTLQNVANAPPITTDVAKLTLNRAAISSQGRIGVLADGEDVYELDMSAPSSWVSRPAGGARPPTYSHFVYYEPADAYISWCGANAGSGGGTTPAVGAFYALRRSTWTWQQLTIQAAVAPTNRSIAATFLVADPTRHQILLFVAYGYTELFALNLAGWA